MLLVRRETDNESEVKKYVIQNLGASIEDSAIVQKRYECLNVKQGTRKWDFFGNCLLGTESEGCTNWIR